MAVDLAGLLSGGAQLASAYIPYEATAGVMSDIQGIADTFVPAANQLGQTAADKAAFSPFAVRTSTGTTDIGAGGALTQTLGQTPQAIQDSLLQQAQAGAGATIDPTAYQGLANQALGQAGGTLGQGLPTAESLYAQMQAIQAPENQRAQLELENRLAAQGRLGTQTAAYGGTPEALAMQKALQEQSAQNMFSAQSLAPQLAQSQIANATGLFGLGSQAQMTPAQLQSANLQNVQSALATGYMPQQQQIAALTPALQAANIAQAGGLGESEALYKAGMQGLQSQAEATGAVAGLEAQRARALGDALQGLFAVEAGQKESAAQASINSFLELMGVGSSGSSSTPTVNSLMNEGFTYEDALAFLS